MAVSNVVTLRPPAPAPDYLTTEQAATWDAIMRSSAGNLIAPEAYPVLAGYCRAISAAASVAKMVDEFDPAEAKQPDGFRKWSKLLAMQERLEGKVASLAVKLRITPSTRIQPRTAGRNEGRGAKPKPWEQ